LARQEEVISEIKVVLLPGLMRLAIPLVNACEQEEQA